MIVQPIVEGPGDENAVPILIRRILSEIIGCCRSSVLRPFKLDRGKMVKEQSCRSHLKISQLNQAVDYVVLLMDSDDDCSKELNERICGWKHDTVYRTLFDVVSIEREFECWLLAGIESLRGSRGISVSAAPPPNPNNIRDPKSRITTFMQDGTSYSETADQAALTAAVDLGEIEKRCPSFRRLVRKLVIAHQERCDCEITGCIHIS